MKETVEVQQLKNTPMQVRALHLTRQAEVSVEHP